MLLLPLLLSVLATVSLHAEHPVISSILHENAQLLDDPIIPEHKTTSPVQVLAYSFEAQVNLAPRQKRQVSMNYVKDMATGPLAMDRATMDELELVNGQVSNRNAALANYLDRTQTDAGHLALRAALLNPIADQKILQARQQALTFLQKTPSTNVRIDHLLSKVARSENLIASFAMQDAVAESFETLLPKFPWYMPFNKQLTRSAQSSSFAANVHRTFYTLGDYFDANPISYIPTFMISAITLNLISFGTYRLTYEPLLQRAVWSGTDLSGFSGHPYDYFTFLGKTIAGSTESVFLNVPTSYKDIRKGQATLSGQICALFSPYIFPYISYLVYTGVDGQGEAFSLSSKTWKALSVASIAPWAVWQGHRTYKNYSLDANRVYFMQQKLMAVARLVESLDETERLVKEYPALAAALPSKNVLNVVLHDKNDSYQSLLRKLRKSTFKGQASYWSDHGRICTTYSLLKEHKEQLLKGLQVIAELDMLRAASKLLQQSTPEKPWCLPTFVADAKTPSVALSNTWHPFLIDIKPVLNNVLFNGTAAAPSTMIITGPNAGGKSTVMKSAVTAVMLAQTLGVAPAQNMKLTPYDTIVSYLNITDDLSQRESLFKASVKRAQEVLVAAQTADKAGKFVLVVLDEVFNGTSSREGSAAAYALVKTLGQLPHASIIVVTHFPLITELGKEMPMLFKNYKVTAIKHADGRLEYPFKLEEGITDQNIAFDVMRNQGYDAAFMKEAQEALERSAIPVAA